MWDRQKGIQPGQEIGVYGAGGGGEQQVDGQPAQAAVFSFTISGALGHHNPERLISSVVYKALIDAIGLHVQTGVKDSPEYCPRLQTAAAAKRGHDCQVHLGGRRNTVTEFLYSVTVLLGTEELPVPLHLVADNGGSGQAHLVHPDGIKVSAELLTIQLHIDEPVVIVLGEGARIVDQIVGGQVVLAELLFDGEGVTAGQRHNGDATQCQFPDLVLKLPFLIVPEDDPALVKLWQRGGKSFV